MSNSCVQSCDSSPLDSCVYGIFQARILVWVAISFSRGSSWPRDLTQVSCTAGRCVYWLSQQGSPYLAEGAAFAEAVSLVCWWVPGIREWSCVRRGQGPMMSIYPWFQSWSVFSRAAWRQKGYKVGFGYLIKLRNCPLEIWVTVWGQVREVLPLP